MKKYLWALPCALLSTSALADNCSFSGFQVGLEGGMLASHSDLKIDSAAPAVTKSYSSDLGSSNGIMGLFVGYGKTFGSVYMGLDGFAKFQSGKSANENGEGNSFKYHYETKIKHSFGAAVKLGVPMKNFMPYITLGAASTKIRFEASRLNGDLFSNITNKNRTAFQGGAGVDCMLSSNWIMGVKYLYSHYKDLKASQLINPSDATKGTFNYKVKPRTSEFTVKVAYKF